MKRFTYNLSSLFHQNTAPGYLRPVAMFETSPGETFYGSAMLESISDPFAATMLNQAFLDVYFFYVPFRLVWDLWPDFISSKDTGQQYGITVPTQVPICTDTAPTDIDEALAIGTMFVKQKLFADPTTPTNFAINALPLWCISLIYNTYFNRSQSDPVAYPEDAYDLSAWANSLRTTKSHRTFHEALALTEEDVTTVPDTTSVDTLRGSFAEDRFNKIRAFYGHKYVDYLKTLGVEAQMGIIDNPELIGKVSVMYKQNMVANTGVTADLAENGGYYSIQGHELKLKKFFASEHGMIIGVANAQVEYSNSGYSHPVYGKHAPEHFWSPQYDSETVQTYSAPLYVKNGTAAFSSLDFSNQRYLDLKTGFKLVHLEAGNSAITNQATYVGATTLESDNEAVAKNNMLNASDQAMFANYSGGQGFYTKNRMKLFKNSPISKFQRPIY